MPGQLSSQQLRLPFLGAQPWRVAVIAPTGRYASNQVAAMTAAGTPIIGGVALGRGGTRLDGLPLYDRIGDLPEPPTIALIYTPAEGVRDAIASGLRTTFTYELELRAKGAIWLDRTVAIVTITISDQYDNLTRRHTLTRSVDGDLEETLVTEKEAAVRVWLTKGTRIPLCATAKLDPARDYYVRVTTRTRPVTGSPAPQ